MFGFPGRFAKSEEERLRSHIEKFGTAILPPRGFGTLRDVALNIADVVTTPIAIATSITDETVREVIHKLKFSNPEPISREEAVEAIAESKWARHWAEGMLRLAGVTPSTPGYEERLEELSRRIAEKVVS